MTKNKNQVHTSTKKIKFTPKIAIFCQLSTQKITSLPIKPFLSPRTRIVIVCPALSAAPPLLLPKKPTAAADIGAFAQRATDRLSFSLLLSPPLPHAAVEK
jgi:hypothetical protein